MRRTSCLGRAGSGAGTDVDDSRPDADRGAKAVAKFGEPGVVELASIQGYYAYLAMVMNVAKIGVAPGVSPQLERFPRLGTTK